jgi:drug/metabolite transporter (DMT)-like permease
MTPPRASAAARAAHPPASHARRRAFQIGFALCIINTLIGATQPVLMRWGATNLDPLLFCTGAVVTAAACAVALLGWRGELGLLVDRRYRTGLLGMSMVGTVMTSLTVTFGLSRIGAIAGVILLQTEPVYSLGLATVVVGERPSRRQLVATATILVGIGSVFGAGGAFSPLWAAALVFVTPLFWQTSHVIGLKLMPPLTVATVTGGRMFYAAVVLAILVLLFRPGAIGELRDPRALAAVLATGFFIYFLSALTWYGAISRLSLTWTTALVVPGVPLISILFAVVFLGEHASTREIAGILIALTGVIALVLGADPHRQLPAGEAAEAIHQPIS